MKLTRRGLFRGAGLAAIAAVGASLPLIEQGWSLSSPSTALVFLFAPVARTITLPPASLVPGTVYTIINTSGEPLIVEAPCSRCGATTNCNCRHHDPPEVPRLREQIIDGRVVAATASCGQSVSVVFTENGWEC